MGKQLNPGRQSFWPDSSLARASIPLRRGLRYLVRRSAAGSHCTSNFSTYTPVFCTTKLYEDIPARFNENRYHVCFGFVLLTTFIMSASMARLETYMGVLHGRTCYWFFFFLHTQRLAFGSRSDVFAFSAFACSLLGRDIWHHQKRHAWFHLGVRSHGINFSKKT